jgi:hypothetical protein
VTARDSRGRFATGMNSLFHARAPLRVRVAHPEAHVTMNELLRGGRVSSSGGPTDEPESPAHQDLDGGAGRDLAELNLANPADYMGALIRAKAGRGSQRLGTAPNGLPIRVE